MDLDIRKIGENDLASVVELIREFAAFEELSDHCEVTEGRLRAALFDDDATTEGLIAFDSERPVAYALFFPNFSSFRGQRGFYLDDIYVNETYRRHGVGEKMLREIARIAAARGYERIDFLVLEWNEPARRFYKKLGADQDPEERHFKFTDQAFRVLSS